VGFKSIHTLSGSRLCVITRSYVTKKMMAVGADTAAVGGVVITAPKVAVYSPGGMVGAPGTPVHETVAVCPVASAACGRPALECWVSESSTLSVLPADQ
jgi:hypothetical protein